MLPRLSGLLQPPREAALVLAITAINAWNRIGVTTRPPVGSLRR